MKIIVHVLSLAFSFALAAGAPASAWESVYGLPATEDQAARGVQPVPACGFFPPGYIAVGTQNVIGPSDVYVVLTDVLGNPVWEQTYDIEGGGPAAGGPYDAALLVLNIGLLTNAGSRRRTTSGCSLLLSPCLPVC